MYRHLERLTVVGECVEDLRVAVQPTKLEALYGRDTTERAFVVDGARSLVAVIREQRAAGASGLAPGVFRFPSACGPPDGVRTTRY